MASRSDSHTPRGTPSARANPSARSHSSSNTSASHVHPSPPSSAVRPAPANGLSWRHTAAAQAFDAPALAIPENGGRALLQPPQSRAMLPAKGRHGGSAPSLGAAAVVSAASLPSSVTDPSAFDGATDDPPIPPPRHPRPAASFDQKRHTGNDRSPYPSTGPHTPSGRLVYTPRCAAAPAECMRPPGAPHGLPQTRATHSCAEWQYRLQPSIASHLAGVVQQALSAAVVAMLTVPEVLLQTWVAVTAAACGCWCDALPWACWELCCVVCRTAGEDTGRPGAPQSAGSTVLARHSATPDQRSSTSAVPCAPARRSTAVDLWEQADVGKKVERWQEVSLRTGSGHRRDRKLVVQSCVHTNLYSTLPSGRQPNNEVPMNHGTAVQGHAR